MSDSETPWDQYLGKLVMVQLRTQPYIGVTREDLIPVTGADGEFMSTPLVRGFVQSVLKDGDDHYMVIRTTDPDQKLSANVVEIALSVKRDIGYLTTVQSSKVQLA
jgi:hypothetical protein